MRECRDEHTEQHEARCVERRRKDKDRIPPPVGCGEADAERISNNAPIRNDITTGARMTNQLPISFPMMYSDRDTLLANTSFNVPVSFSPFTHCR